MKVLLDHSLPFLLAHGGVQVLIERTWNALKELGLEVEPLRWWDDRQTGDLIHFYGRVPTDYLRFAQRKGFAVVMSDLLSGTGARAPLQLALQTAMVALFRRTMPESLRARLAWESYQEVDAIIMSTPLEARLVKSVFSAPSDRVQVVTNGVDDIFFQATKAVRGPWLLSTGRITQVKRVLELAHAAVLARTPLWVVGRPMAPDDPYAQTFFQFVKEHPEGLRHDSFLPLEALAQAYQQARGFVLLSQWESLSLAALEASASGCPLLLSDLPWARSAFGEQVSYCPLTTVNKTANTLRLFYDKAPDLAPPTKPLTWKEVAVQLKSVYQQVLDKKRGCGTRPLKV